MRKHAFSGKSLMSFTLRIASIFVFSALCTFPAWTQNHASTVFDKEPQISVPCGPSFFKAKGAWAAMIGCETAACLDEIALRLSQDSNLILVIDGHRDEKERSGISLNRACHTQRYLIEDRGIEAERISVRNFSDTCPHQAEDRALNRRVEYWLIPYSVSIDEIEKLKKCAEGSLPAFNNPTEKPVRWRYDWKSESLY